MIYNKKWYLSTDMYIITITVNEIKIVIFMWNFLDTKATEYFKYKCEKHVFSSKIVTSVNWNKTNQLLFCKELGVEFWYFELLNMMFEDHFEIMNVAIKIKADFLYLKSWAMKALFPKELNIFALRSINYCKVWLHRWKLLTTKTKKWNCKNDDVIYHRNNECMDVLEHNGVKFNLLNTFKLLDYRCKKDVTQAWKLVFSDTHLQNVNFYCSF